MYPLTEAYIPKIDDFLTELHQTPGLRVETNNMSTQVFGEATLTFTAINKAIARVYENTAQCPFVLKVLKGDVSQNVVKNYA
jgi:uncharacterized protein YqgV (UPF0045/DUF77 family)